MTTAPRRRVVENRWIGRGGGIDSTGGAREHRHCRLNRARLCRPPASASVAVATHASASRARFQTTPPTPPPICGHPTVQHHYPRTDHSIYSLLLLRSHAATGVTLVRRKRRRTPRKDSWRHHRMWVWGV